MGQFSAGPINKAVPNYINSLTIVLNGDGRYCKRLTYKSVSTYSVCTVLNS